MTFRYSPSIFVTVGVLYASNEPYRRGDIITFARLFRRSLVSCLRNPCTVILE